MKSRTVLLAVLILFIASQVFIIDVHAQSTTLLQSFGLSLMQKGKPILADGTPPRPLLNIIGQFILDVSQGLLSFFQKYWAVIICDLLCLALVFQVVPWLYNLLKAWNDEARGKIGPILIEDVVGKPETAVLMRKYLASCGAECCNALAPSASPGFEKISAALAGTSDPKAQLIGVFLSIISAIEYIFKVRKVGYTITCLFTGDESKPPVYIYTEIKLTRNGQIKRSFSFDGNTNEEAIKKTAYWVFWYLSGRKNSLQKIPLWHRFPTAESYLNYKDASETKTLCFRKANELYQEAVKEAPFNALVRLDWGDLNETYNQYLEALEIYLEAVLMWPHLYGFWYRIAAIFSCPEEWIELQWNAVEHDKKQYLMGLVERLIRNNNLSAHPAIWFDNQNIELDREDFDRQLANEFYKLSLDVWFFLEKEFKHMGRKWRNQVWIELKAHLFDPIRNTPNLTQYYRKLIPILGWQEGQQFLRSVQLAQLCTTVQQSILNEPEKSLEDLIKDSGIREVEKIVRYWWHPRHWWNTMGVYYNAACYYAQLSARGPQYISEALSYLKIAFKDPGDSPDLLWVQNDPDLKPLRDNPEYIALFVDPNNKQISNDRKDENDKLYALVLLQLGVQQQQEDWGSASDKTQLAEALVVEAEYQINLWDSLVKLMNTPDDPLQQQLFWQLVMQRDKANDIPAPRQNNQNISSQKINTAWENITDHALPQLDTWKNRLADGKLFLQQADSHNLNDIWKMWKQSEIWLWDYYSDQIEKVMKIG